MFKGRVKGQLAFDMITSDDVWRHVIKFETGPKIATTV